MDLSTIHTSGLDIVRSIQAHRSHDLDLFFSAFTSLGSELFYVVALPLLWWNLGSMLGLRISIGVLISVWSNLLLKKWLGHPRPYDLDPSVAVLLEQDYGAPSGHAQQSIVFWGLLAIYAQKRSLWILGFLMVGLLGLSRIYLGVHFPTDVLLGWLLGIAIILGMVYLGPIVARNIGPNALLYVAIGTFIVTLWVALFVKDGPLVSFGAGISGLVLGEAWSNPRRHVRISSFWHRMLVSSAGLLGLMLFYFGLKGIFPIKGDPMYLAGVFVRYSFCGFWTSYIVPKIFRLNVSQ